MRGLKIPQLHEITEHAESKGLEHGINFWVNFDSGSVCLEGETRTYSFHLKAPHQTLVLEFDSNVITTIKTWKQKLTWFLKRTNRI